MTVNFRTREISRNVHKLNQTPTINLKKEKNTPAESWIPTQMLFFLIKWVFPNHLNESKHTFY